MPRTPTRLFVNDDLAAGATPDLTPAQARYLGGVLRLSAGDPVALFNGRDGEWRAVLTTLDRKRGRVVVGARTRSQAAEEGPWLLFAPLKKDRTDFLAEKAVELGASVLWPVRTRHTQSGRVNLGRLRAQCVEAAEQCGRLTLPGLRDPCDLGAALAAWVPARPLVAADESGAGRPTADWLDGHLGPPPGLLIGPEGGFGDGELDGLDALPFAVRVSLGPRLLRAETAAVAALAAWQARRGDWTRPPKGQHTP